jgi:hypothetical protein
MLSGPVQGNWFSVDFWKRWIDPQIGAQFCWLSWLTSIAGVSDGPHSNLALAASARLMATPRRFTAEGPSAAQRDQGQGVSAEQGCPLENG